MIIDTKKDSYKRDLRALEEIRRKVREQVTLMIGVKVDDKRRIVARDPRLLESLKMAFELQGLLQQVGDMVHDN